jgi:tRNA(Ile)-lysidine synthase
MTKILNKQIRESLSRNFSEPSRFLLAVSGGPDSQVLIKSFSHVCRDFGHSVSALGVNHGLRQEADYELDLAESLCDSIKVPFTRVKIHLEKGSDLQNRARIARYEILLDAASKDGSNVVTAHHFNDRAETVLIRLLRSTDAKCLAVLPELQSYKYKGHHIGLYRPMLQVTRDEIMAYAKRWRIPYATDPSNGDDHYLRVWVRNTLLPLLREKSPAIDEKLNKISDDLM